MTDITLYGFDASTYVRTVKMVLIAKGATFDQVPVNVLAGEPHSPEHLARHPFGKVPVLDHGSLRIIETSAIVRYLDEVLAGPSFVPATAADRARMNMGVGLVDSYGYGSLIGGIAAYHLFPDLVGGKNEAARAAGIEQGKRLLAYLMTLRGNDNFIAGETLSLADLFLAPICAYVAMTPDAGSVFGVPGFAAWWDRMQADDLYKKTAPDLG